MKKKSLSQFVNCLTVIFILSGMLSGITSCSGGGENGSGPKPFPSAGVSYSPPGNYALAFAYHYDPQCAISSVSVTGPLLPGPALLTCNWGEWGGIEVPLGTTNPQPLLPLVYTFTVIDSTGTRQETATANCVWDLLATPVEPTNGSILTNPVTFRWNKVSGLNIEYTVRVVRSSGPGPVIQIPSVIDSSSLEVSLPTGSYADYLIFSGPAGWTQMSPSGGTCSSKAAAGWGFTVQ